MNDPNFFQTVVLMIEHNKEGAFGLVVNRRSRLLLADGIEDLEREQAALSTPLYIGGPVQREFLFVVHGEMPEDHVSSDACVEVVRDVYFEPSFRYVKSYFVDESLAGIPADDRPSIHLFLGYSGWAAGQLEEELRRGSWMVHPASKRIVFHENPEQGWKEALRQKGGIYKIFADSDPNPSLN